MSESRGNPRGGPAAVGEDDFTRRAAGPEGSDDLAEIERRMQPGAWDTKGFLRPGCSLAEVVADDARRLAALGIDPADLGRRLADLLAAAGIDRATRLGDHLVGVVRQRGFVTCPWAPGEFEPCSVGEGSRPTADRFRIEDVRSGRRLEGFVIGAHLIRDHGFFGGPETRFRLEPEAVAQLFEPRATS